MFVSMITSFFVHLQAQSIRQPDLYTTELGTYLSTSLQTPFWLRANQYGIVPNQSPGLTLRLGVYGNYDSTKHHTNRWRDSPYDVGYGLSIVANGNANQLSYEKTVLLPEAYVKVRRGIWEAYIGRRRERFGLADSTLSTGSYSWSGNAMPIPKIQVSIPVFTPLGFTKGFVAIQGTFAHGVLGSSGFVKNTLLHQSSFYLRLGRPASAVKVYGGFTHQAVWGGQVADPQASKGIPGVIPVGGKLPSSLIDYFYVVTGINAGRTDTTKYTYFDLTNRVGNHLGSIDIGIDVDLVRHTLFFYRQNLYETGSLFYLTSIADGLNGIRIRRNDPNALIRDILVEFLNTTSQGGSQFVITDPQRRGKVDYFNHQQYRDGWAYRQHTIGTPFIPPALGPNDEYPYGTFTANNRVRVFHVGMSGSLPVRLPMLTSPVAYQIKLSYSQNLGTYDNPYKPTKNQLSGYVGLTTPVSILGGVQLTGNVAFDIGTLYRNSVGTYISLRKTWGSSGR